MGRKVVVSDKMQPHYEYECTASFGRITDSKFTPELTPKEMLALGVFGGVYMRDCTDEFPADWFTDAKFQKPGIYTRDAALNFFGVNASKSLAYWQQKGWIHKDDPRGWFQWYCRYYMGRRHEDDARQIKRWRAFKRHVAQVKAHCKKGDHVCRSTQRQALLHWAYDSREI